MSSELRGIQSSGNPSGIPVDFDDKSHSRQLGRIQKIAAHLLTSTAQPPLAPLFCAARYSKQDGAFDYLSKMIELLEQIETQGRSEKNINEIVSFLESILSVEVEPENRQQAKRLDSLIFRVQFPAFNKLTGIQYSSFFRDDDPISLFKPTYGDQKEGDLSLKKGLISHLLYLSRETQKEFHLEDLYSGARFINEHHPKFYVPHLAIVVLEALIYEEGVESREAIDLLIQVVKKPEYSHAVREEAANSLGRISTIEREAAPEILDALSIHLSTDHFTALPPMMMLIQANSKEELNTLNSQKRYEIFKRLLENIEFEHRTIIILRELLQKVELPYDALAGVIYRTFHLLPIGKNPALEILATCIKMPDNLFGNLIDMFRNGHPDVPSEIGAAVLGGQKLPKEVLEALLAIAKDPAENNRNNECLDAIAYIVESEKRADTELFDFLVEVLQSPSNSPWVYHRICRAFVAVADGNGNISKISKVFLDELDEAQRGSFDAILKAIKELLDHGYSLDGRILEAITKMIPEIAEASYRKLSDAEISSVLTTLSAFARNGYQLSQSLMDALVDLMNQYDRIPLDYFDMAHFPLRSHVVALIMEFAMHQDQKVEVDKILRNLEKVLLYRLFIDHTNDLGEAIVKIILKKKSKNELEKWSHHEDERVRGPILSAISKL